MQAGFATLSAGSIRAKNVKNILLKNLLDARLPCRGEGPPIDTAGPRGPSESGPRQAGTMTAWVTIGRRERPPECQMPQV